MLPLYLFGWTCGVLVGAVAMRLYLGPRRPPATSSSTTATPSGTSSPRPVAPLP
jgi:hypothetical protein